MKICVFCSANDHIDAEYFARAEELGKWIAEQGHTLVFGGCNMGLMECVARAVKENGGRTIGVIPSMVEKRGRISDYVDTSILCDNLSDRKDLMVAQSDLFIALPGGVGTLDEIFTVVAAHTIGYHHKQVILYNINGFWDKTIEMLDDLQQRGFIRGDWRDIIRVEEKINSLTLTSLTPGPSPWREGSE